MSNVIYKIKSLLASTKLTTPGVSDEKTNVKSICLILINVGLGDAIMATSFLRVLKDTGHTVDILIAKKLTSLFENNNDINNIIIAGDESYRAKEEYDLVIDPYSHCGWYFTYKYMKVLSTLKYKKLSGFDVKIPGKYSDNYIPDTKAIHITDYYRHIVDKYIGHTTPFPDNYILHFSDESRLLADKYIASLPSGSLNVAFCPFASTNQRSFSEQQINSLLDMFAMMKNVSVILLMEKEKLEKVTLQDNTFYFEAPNFSSAAAVLCACDFVISVDTSFVHVANSHNKPLLAFYSSVYNDGYNTDTLCGPNYSNARQIINEKGISEISPDYIYAEVVKELERI